MSGTPIRVLVAEDDEDHRFLIVRALRSTEGLVLEIDTVSDGEQAVDLLFGRGRYAGRQLPHLVLLDLKMPKLSGLEVLQRVKDDPELREIPIVVLSSSERPEDISATYLHGANSYVTKPSTAHGLREGLSEMSHYWTRVAVLPDPDA